MAVKQPQDRMEKKPKVERLDGARAVTVSGVRVVVPDDAIDDFELLEDMAQMGRDEKKAAAFPAVLRRLVGDDGFTAVMDGLRGPNGRVKVADGMGFIRDLLAALNPNS